MNTISEAIQRTLGHEGGFTDDPNDYGNWTGGKIGVGECRGTKYGISASAYPTLDIKNLTIEQATTIYLNDYWQKMGLSQLNSLQVAWMIFDIGVNFTQSTGIKVLQHILDTVEDGNLGPKTAALANAQNELQLLIAIGKERAMRHCNKVIQSPETIKWLKGWIARSFDLGY